MPGGRPTDFTPEVGEDICTKLVTLLPPQNSLVRICRPNDMPSRTSVYNWLLKAKDKDSDPKLLEFLDRYETAMILRADNLFDEIIEVAYNDLKDETVNIKGDLVQNTEYIARSRLKVDALKWCLSKMIPKKYGDRIHQEHSGEIGLTLLEQIMADEGGDE